MPMQTLRRELGVGSAVLLGLGSIVGTGVFVSVAVAAGAAQGWIVWATMAAALVATFNALSSAQLAAAHPVSGGTYEYGHQFLTPALGFTAGWMFLCAKSASAATAALGFAGYALDFVGVDHGWARIALALAAVGLLVAIVLSGVRRSSHANTVIVSLVFGALLLFVFAGLWRMGASEAAGLESRAAAPEWGSFLEGVALMFVAYTGYGRIATLGEEVRDPARTIPRAIIITLVLTAALYGAVAWVASSLVGPVRLAALAQESGAPLEAVLYIAGMPWVARLVSLGAMVAMLGVLLNLILGLSRVLLAMGRRGHMPPWMALVDTKGQSPYAAVLVVGLVIALMACSGSIAATWSFSAFTVLIYYALTNLSAWYLPKEQRRYPRIIPALGFAACAGLCWWVDTQAWMLGLAVLGAGWLWMWAQRFTPWGRERA